MSPKDTWTRRIDMLLLSRLEQLAADYYRGRRYSEAARAVEKALKIARRTYGPRHAYVAACTNNLVLLNKIQEDRGFLTKGTRDKFKKSFRTGQRMKTSLFFKLSAALLLIVFTSAGFIGAFTTFMSGDSQPVYASVSRAGTLPYYRVKARFYPENKTILGTEEVIFECREPRKEVVFNLYLNRYNNNKLNNSEIRRYALERGKDQGCIDIQWVSEQEKPVQFRQEGEMLRVSPEHDFFSPGKHTLKIGFQVKIPYLADRVGGNEHGIWLGNWLPTLSVDAKEYRPTEIGDPYLNFSSTYEVLFTVPGNYNLILSNIDSIREQGDIKTYHGKLEQVRDFPIFLNKSYREAGVLAGETEIHYYYTSPHGRPAEVLAAAKKAVSYFKNNVGEYPWKQLNIVENDMYLNGMEYSTLILLSAKALQNNLAETVFHEVGHQWFYNIIGSDQYNAPFIDEGMVEFFTSSALRKSTPGYSSHLPLQQNLGQFRSWQEYREVHYRNGRRLFESIYVSLGKNEFEKFIKEYYDKYKFGFITTDEFKTILEGKIGARSTRELLN